MKELAIGSYPSATMLERDLIPCFMDALKKVDPERAEQLKSEYVELNADADKNGWRSACDLFSEDVGFLLGALFVALNACCPPYCYFGASEGDGAGYGCWPMVHSLGKDIRCGNVTDYDKVTGLALSVGDLVCEINEHGNTSLYRVKQTLELEEIWAIV